MTTAPASAPQRQVVAGMPAQRLSAAFVVEDALGHVTHARALRAAAAERDDLAAHFVQIPYTATDWPGRLRGLSFSARLSLRARSALAQLPQAPQALFFHTQALLPACWHQIASTPSVISMDATPADFNQLAFAYDSQVATGTKGRIKHLMFRSLFGRAQAFVAMSAWVRDGLQRDYGVEASRISVIPPGIDTAEFSPPPPRAAGGPTRLLFVGGNFLRKGGATLLQAWRAGLSADCELDIVSRDADIPPAPGLRVHTGLSPGDPALRALFARADLFLHPSQGDASPFAIVEALSSGLPVIATAVGAVHEMVIDGRTGLVVPVGDATALLAAVRALATDAPRRAAMAAAARAMALAQFDGRRNAHRVLDLVAAAARGETP
ncbi:glycosyltransferase family 4 protein [Ideonella sp. DXS22W]|uniref:Glycosyltransferase family 4 protein n=1 Tax=Pseudaquabacterium inlustre TaxID=2984192 RepID=A0ABU9CIZ9_9BURK